MANRHTITRPSSSKTKTCHVTRSKPMSRQNTCKGGYNIKHCEKWLPLRLRTFRERSNFPRIWFWDLRFRIWGLQIKHKHKLRVTRVFFFHYYLELRQPIEVKFSQVCYFMHRLTNTKWEDWSLTITNSVHSEFKQNILKYLMCFWTSEFGQPTSIS